MRRNRVISASRRLEDVVSAGIGDNCNCLFELLVFCGPMLGYGHGYAYCVIRPLPHLLALFYGFTAVDADY